MTKKKPSTTSKASASAQAAVAQTQEQLLQQEVLRHYAKTVYFNDLWKSFLSKLAGLVLLISGLMLRRAYLSAEGLRFHSLFEVLSLLVALATVMFVRRWLDPLLAFKTAFVLALLQVGWYAHSYYHRFMEQDREDGDLREDQFAMGAMYFAFCWLADRYMMRSQDVAKHNAAEMTELVNKKIE